jgi:hypothetical protein
MDLRITDAMAAIATIAYSVMLRLYSPLESFYTKEWRPSEIELVR